MQCLQREPERPSLSEVCLRPPHSGRLSRRHQAGFRGCRLSGGRFSFRNPPWLVHCPLLTGKGTSGIFGEHPRPCGPGVYTCYPSLGSAVSSSFMRRRLSSSERLRNLLQVTRLASHGAGADSTLHMVNTNSPQEGNSQIGEAPGIQTRLLLPPPNLLVSPVRSFSERLSHPWLLQATNTCWVCKCVRELLTSGKGNGGEASEASAFDRTPHAPLEPALRQRPPAESPPNTLPVSCGLRGLLC